MGSRKNYDEEYKAQAVKLAREKGGRKAAEELGISSKTLYGWMSKATNGRVLWTPKINPPSLQTIVNVV